MKRSTIYYYGSICCTVMMFWLTPFIGLNAYANPLSHIKAAISQIVSKAQAQKSFNIGVVVENLANHKILYTKRANQLFTPASVMKLLTATAAFIQLGPNYRFSTTLRHSGHITAQTLHGNLFIHFSGDPLLTCNQLQQLLRQLNEHHIRHITGHVIIDTSSYNAVPYPPGWVWDDLSFAYAPPLKTIIINHNNFNLRFIPTEAKHRATLDTNLPPSVIHLFNHVYTYHHLRPHCGITIYSDAQNHYYIFGCLRTQQPKQSRHLAIRDMLPYAKVIIKQSLHAQGISTKKSIENTITPIHATAKILTTHHSPPLKTIIVEMLKKSDNLTTNTLLKKLGEMAYQPPGTWQKGLKALRYILHEAADIQFKQSVVADGSGLSRYNLISPHQLLQLLNFVYYSPYKKSLIAALPIAGKDGTLKHRMLAIEHHEDIHAKTGTMTGVTALAGFVLKPHQPPLAFVIMIDHFVGSARRYEHLENQICNILLNASTFKR